jgi:hypothetical protein
MRGHLSYANVVSTIAVFCALGGTGYAAMTVTGKNVKDESLTGKDIRRNSIRSSDVKALTGADVTNGSLLAADFKPGQLPAGAKGDEGAQGARGEKGDKGDKGDTGPAGPTAMAFGGGATPPGLGGFPAIDTVASAQITVPASGRLLAFGMPTSDLRRQSPPAGSTIHLGLYLDGQPIPGSDEALTGGSNAVLGPWAPVQGHMDAVAPGPHLLELSFVSDSGITIPAGGSATVSAVFVGGN